MTSQRWPRVRQILEHIIEMSEAERAAYLAEACADDKDLRNQVEDLLAQEKGMPPDFLVPPEIDI